MSKKDEFFLDMSFLDTFICNQEFTLKIDLFNVIGFTKNIWRFTLSIHTKMYVSKVKRYRVTMNRLIYRLKMDKKTGHIKLFFMRQKMSSH